MTDKSSSSLIVSSLQQNAEALLRNNWLEVWSLYAGGGRPLRISLCHVIVPRDDGSFRVKTSLSFGLRLTYCEQQELAAPPSEPSRLQVARSSSNVAVRT
jgi:hypothetical protein